jgi:Raf kinase inhibitor-like YbhB/YbcL family protein
MTLEVKVDSFAYGAEIPRRYTCGGANLSPVFNWGGVSPAAKSLAIVVDDPDAPKGTWTHWILWNIPSFLTALPEGLFAAETLADGTRQGTNDFSRIGYGGPCPPPGKPHRYFFKLFALDTLLDLQPGAKRKELDHAMRGHILSQADWMGTYGG